MEKSRLCKWVQIIGFIGVILVTLSIVLQALRYEPGLRAGGAIAVSFIGLIAMAITTLYANGVLAKLTKKKGFYIFIRFSVFALILISLKYILGTAYVVAYILHGIYAPLGKVEGADKYDKTKLVEKYASDLNSRLLLFPESLDGAVEADYHQGLKEGIFDTDGYVFLEVTYSDAYEYALLDEKSDTIIYAALSYPEFYQMSKYKDYLKKSRSEYRIGDTSGQFTIYY